MGVTDSNKNQAKTGNYNPVELEKEVAERWGKDKTFENSNNKFYWDKSKN